MGNVVGMAFIVARPRGRFEIRESVHTDRGPRSRSLANFAVLTGDVLRTAAGRATRPFDADRIVAAAKQKAVPMRELGRGAPERARRFVQASRRLAQELDSAAPRDGRARGPNGQARDPGTALIELIGFGETVARSRTSRASRPGRRREPLAYPVLTRLPGRNRPTPT